MDREIPRGMLITMLAVVGALGKENISPFDH